MPDLSREVFLEWMNGSFSVLHAGEMCLYVFGFVFVFGFGFVCLFVCLSSDLFDFCCLSIEYDLI